MPQSYPVADQAATTLVRRLVLGTALALGLALAPRTATVHAQEPKAAAPAARTQPTTKTLTITDGQNQARIELKKEGGPPAKGSATPGDSPEDEEASPSD